jgi:hypothetical protein
MRAQQIQIESWHDHMLEIVASSNESSAHINRRLNRLRTRTV